MIYNKSFFLRITFLIALFLFLIYLWLVSLFISVSETSYVTRRIFEPHINVLKNTSIKYPLLSSPAEHYPAYKPLQNIITYWNPDIPEPPKDFTEVLQHFDYKNVTERMIAEKYRNLELPFKMYNVQEILDVEKLWSDKYLIRNINGIDSHVELSSSNHFMYSNSKLRYPKNTTRPTKSIHLPFSEWLKMAKNADISKLSNSSEHYYFMIGTDGKIFRNFISKDIKVFSANNNFFVTNVKMNKGIQCRFGMRGVIAESHYDGGRNMVAMVKGSKRYILTPPRTCKQLDIISNKKHPSYRHSVIDWSDIDQVKSRGFDTVDAIETIVKQGEILYIPSYWFHYVVSLQYSIQCNSRSGTPPNGEGVKEIIKCVGRQAKKKSTFF